MDINQFDRHEHDRLTTFFFRNGRQVDASVGRTAYGVKDSAWMTCTSAHNCIVIDEASSNAVGGRLVAFNPALPKPPLPWSPVIRARRSTRELSKSGPSP